jgi:opacity protein-like surface antigen
MKKSIFALLILAGMAFTAQAQEKRWWVGGTVGYSSSDFGSRDTGESLTIQPELGYNLSDRWALGIQFGLSQADLTTTDHSYADFQRFSVAPFARYTFLKWKAFSVFADGGIGFSDFTGDTDFGDNVSENAHLSSFGLSVNPGFALRLTDRFSLIGRTNLFSAAHSWNDHIADWNVGLNSPFNLDDIEIGVTFKF